MFRVMTSVKVNSILKEDSIRPPADSVQARANLFPFLYLSLLCSRPGVDASVRNDAAIGKRFDSCLQHTSFP